jgi:hypothetical protein
MCSIAAALAACGSKKDATAPAKTDAPAAPAPAPAPAKPAAPVKVAVALPGTVAMAAPAVVQFAGKSVTSEPCKLDKRAPDMKDENGSQVIRDIAIGPDGALYVLDDQHRVRKYLVQSASPCELALDTTWGQKGLATVGDAKDADGVLGLAIDAKGTVYTSGSGIYRVGADGKATLLCGDHPGDLRIDAATDTAYFNQKKILLDGSCTTSDVPAFESLMPHNLTAGGNGELFVNHDVKNVEKIAVFKDGKQLGELGPSDGDQADCGADSVTSCAAGACVIDFHCERLRAWSFDGKLVSSTDLKPLLGVTSTMWPMRIVTGKDAAWIAYSVRPEQPPEEQHFFGMISRVTGL